ncbi:MAG: fibronectin type III domain-containing protein, partial [Candidatus Omnitrophota bacterium]
MVNIYYIRKKIIFLCLFLAFFINLIYAAVPQIPQNLSAVATSATSIRITWNSASGAERYKVTNKNTGVETGNIYGTSYEWTGLNQGQNYCFTVKACNTYGCSFESYQACAATG